MGQEITVTAQPGANADVRIFSCNRSITGMAIESYANAKEAKGSRAPDVLAQRLFDLGATTVTVYSSDVTVEAPAQRWAKLEPQVIETIEHLFGFYGDDAGWSDEALRAWASTPSRAPSRRRSPTMSLRNAWEGEAEAWASWASTPGHDRFFWLHGLPNLLELLPPPGVRTLDLGCGEGRLSRLLIERGHHVIGIDGSATLARLASSHDDGAPVVQADAAALPVAAGTVDLAVASMSLQDVDDLAGAVTEIAAYWRRAGGSAPRSSTRSTLPARSRARRPTARSCSTSRISTTGGTPTSSSAKVSR